MKTQDPAWLQEIPKKIINKIIWNQPPEIKFPPLVWAVIPGIIL